MLVIGFIFVCLWVCCTVDKIAIALPTCVLVMAFCHLLAFI